MLIVVLLFVAVAVALVVVAVVVPAAARQRRFSEVDRFHRARAMTTSWARAGVTSPVPTADREQQEVDDRVA